MSIIDLPDEPPPPLDAPLLYRVYRAGCTYPEEYSILKPFNMTKIELSLTVRGERPTLETIVEFLLIQGFITPFRVH